MKKISLSAMLILGIASLASTAVFAGANTVKDCALEQWCPLPHTSDVVRFFVDAKYSSEYDCTLVVGGNSLDPTREVFVQVAGDDGFNMTTGEVESFAGHSSIFRVSGTFTHQNGYGGIKIRRLIGSTNTQDVSVMCEKKFS